MTKIVVLKPTIYAGIYKQALPEASTLEPAPPNRTAPEPPLNLTGGPRDEVA
jgi:hypothetical protein